MPHIEFTVIGEPAPQGSKRHIGNGVLIESSKKVKPWRQAVEYEAIEARRGRDTITEPVMVDIRFYLRRPKTAAKSRRYPDRKPDLDKLVRSTLDAIVTAGVIADDSQVIIINACKLYSIGNFAWPAGAEIEIFTQ